MAVPEYGAAPLAKFFLMVRILSLIAMICIVGITANFVSEIVSTNIEPPREVVATLATASRLSSHSSPPSRTRANTSCSQTSIAAFYCLISIPIFYARANLGLLIMTAVDSGLLLSFVVIAVCVGRPLSFLNCSVIASSSSAADAQSAAMFAQSLRENINVSGARLDLANWAGSTKMNCYQTKAIWGMCIGLCILFASSVMVLPTLFFKARKAGGAGAKSAV